jgi:hypothetical protein
VTLFLSLLALIALLLHSMFYLNKLLFHAEDGTYFIVQPERGLAAAHLVDANVHASYHRFSIVNKQPQTSSRCASNLVNPNDAMTSS